MKGTIILAAAAAGVAAIAAWRFAAQPAAMQSAGTGTPMVRVAVPGLSGEAAAGESLFNANCAACHGDNGTGREGSGPPLVHVIYEPSHHADAAFQMAVQRGVRSHHWPFGDMPPVEGVGEADVDKIVAYVRTLQRANGIH